MTRHARPRRRAVLLAAAAAVTVAIALAGCEAEPSFSSDLERYGDANGVKNKLVDLPGGDRVSVGSPDRHDVVVQRYDAAAGGWSAPEVVHTEPRLWTHYIDVDTAGSTVAVDVDYWEEEVLADDYAPRMTVGVVCAEKCTPGARPEGEDLSEVELTENGEYAAFDLGEGSVAVWDGDDEWHTEQLEDLGENSDVRLAGDGSYQGLTVERQDEGCVYMLQTTEPQGFDFTERVSSAPALRDCGGSLQTPDKDDGQHAAVWDEVLGGLIEFERSADGWRMVDLPVGYDAVADTGGRSTLAPIHERSYEQHVVLYSPDMRTIWGQAESGHEQWSTPRVAFTVPDGLVCRGGRFAPWPESGAHYALLDCFKEGRGPEGEPVTTLALVSENGTYWSGGLVHGAGRYARVPVRFDVVVSGTPGMLFRSEEYPNPGPERLRLPFPSPATDPLHIGSESVLRVAPRLADGRCTATVWSAASLKAESWTESAAFDAPLVQGRCPDLRLTSLYDRLGGVRVSVEALASWNMRLLYDDGRWTVAPPALRR